MISTFDIEMNTKGNIISSTVKTLINSIKTLTLFYFFTITSFRATIVEELHLHNFLIEVGLGFSSSLVFDLLDNIISGLVAPTIKLFRYRE